MEFWFFIKEEVSYPNRQTRMLIKICSYKKEWAKYLFDPIKSKIFLRSFHIYLVSLRKSDFQGILLLTPLRPIRKQNKKKKTKKEKENKQYSN